MFFKKKQKPSWQDRSGQGPGLGLWVVRLPTSGLGYEFAGFGSCLCEGEMLDSEFYRPNRFSLWTPLGN